jgi:carbonyl reductase 1
MAASAAASASSSAAAAPVAALRDRLVVVVTGANRGIGLEVARTLARDPRVASVVAACRSVEAARRALAAEQKVRVLPLDAASPESVAAFPAALGAGVRVDVLVNNAAVYEKGYEEAVVERTLAINLRGPLQLIDALAPSLAFTARVINLTSGYGDLHHSPAHMQPRLRQWLAEARAGREQSVLDTLRKLCYADVQLAAGDARPSSGSVAAYCLSKACINVATEALQRRSARSEATRAQSFFAVDPGWVRTDMGGMFAPRSVERGADTVVWLVLTDALPDEFRGRVFNDRKPHRFE